LSDGQAKRGAKAPSGLPLIFNGLRVMKEDTENKISADAGVKDAHSHAKGGNGGASGHGHTHGEAGHEHTHCENGHEHTHTHDPEVIRRISLRLAKAEGHLHSVRGMLDSGRDCSEVLVQLAAVRAAVDNAGKELLKEHISHCIVDAIKENDRHELDELNKAIDQFMK
jgi:DNA-binding FrmR family transcriptional regulator